MIIKINKTTYRIDPTIAASAKKVIQTILGSVKIESEIRGIKKYYTTFVVMMYFISSSILSELSSDNLSEIANSVDNDNY